MNIEKLIAMANQIAQNFAAYPAEFGARKLAYHLEECWESRMLNGLFDYVRTDGALTLPMVKVAARSLMEKA